MTRFLTALFVLVPVLVSAQVSPYPLGVSPPIFGLPASAVSGSGAFSPQLFGPESCTVPAYSFTGAATNGYGGSGGTTLCAVIGGTQRLGITSSAVTSTVPVLLPDGTAAAPALAFTTGVNYGLFWVDASNRIDVSMNGTSTYAFDGGGYFTALTGYAFGTVGSADLLVSREGAGHSFQRNSTNAQRASWANTYASTVSYEAFSIDWLTTANVGTAGCRTAATGTGRACRFGAQASNAGTFSYLEIAATGAATLTGAFTSYNGVAVAGQGVDVIRASATTGTVTNAGTASIATWTPGAADVEVEVGCRVNITTSTTHSFSCDVTYTDVANNARTRVLPMYPITGTVLTSGLMTNAIGAGDFGSATIRLGVKASTAIVVRTSAGGTFTTVVYTASGTIKQVQ